MTFSSHQQLFFLAVLLLPMAALGIEDLYHTCGKNFTQNKILQSNINNALLEMVAKSSIYGVKPPSVLIPTHGDPGQPGHVDRGGSGHSSGWSDRSGDDPRRSGDDPSRTVPVRNRGSSQPPPPPPALHMLEELHPKQDIETSIYEYVASSFGVGNDTVYGLTRCQGDMKVEACSACITAAAQKIRTSCPDSAESRIWYDENCFLRYDTENFFKKPEKVIAAVWYSCETPLNSKAFEQAVGELLAEVMEATTSGSSKFGWGENYLNANETIYGMAQCTGDLDAHACNQCLEDALETMSNLCDNRAGCRIIGSSCVMRYETYKFLDLGEAAVAPAPSIVIDHF